MHHHKAHVSPVLIMVFFTIVTVLYSVVFCASEPGRVIIVIDNSMSMCVKYQQAQCCITGDSSGNCAFNDPSNQRILAVNTLIDSLSSVFPSTEVGILCLPANVSIRQPPINLASTENLQMLRSAISFAACEGTQPERVPALPKKSYTNLGSALRVALQQADLSYDTSDKTKSRHIILITDGGWDDLATLSPDSVINLYKATFPNREVPAIHIAFMTDSLLHIEHGYPALGCSGDKNEFVNLEPLMRLTTLVNGSTFFVATPQSIVAHLHTMQLQITGTSKKISPAPRQLSIRGQRGVSGPCITLYNLQGRSVGSTAANSTLTGVYFTHTNGSEVYKRIFLPW